MKKILFFGVLQFIKKYWDSKISYILDGSCSKLSMDVCGSMLQILSCSGPVASPLNVGSELELPSIFNLILFVTGICCQYVCHRCSLNFHLVTKKIKF